MNTTVPPPTTHRRLVRSTDDRMLGGVAGGIAATYGIDVALVRIALATAAVLTAGVVIVGYLIAWAVIPAADGRVIAHDLSDEARRRRHRHRGRVELWIGVGLFVAGLIALSDAWHPGPARVLGPLALIAAGLAVLLYRHDATTTTTTTLPPRPADEPPPFTTVPDGGAPSGVDDDREPGPASDEEPITTATIPTIAPTATTATTATDTAAPAETRSAYETRPWPVTPPPPSPPAPPRPPRPRSYLGRLTLSALLVLFGGAWLVDLTGATDVDAAFVLALGVVVVGAALLVGAWFGRARSLIFVGLVLTFAATVTAAIGMPLRGGIGERVYRPQALSEVRHRYELAIGHLVVDLARVDVTRPLRFEVRDAIGQIEIIVPPDADVTVDGRSNVGALHLFGEPADGGIDMRNTVHSRGSSEHIDIDARVGIGELRVRRAPVLESEEVSQ